METTLHHELATDEPGRGRSGLTMVRVTCLGVAALVFGTIYIAAFHNNPSRVPVSAISYAVSPDDRELIITVSSCHQSPNATANETASQVILTVQADNPGRGGQLLCADGLTMILNEPLAGRTVIDQLTGRALRQR